MHKAQGSEFDVVILPVLVAFPHALSQSGLTGLTQGKKLAVLVGSRQALAMAVRNQDTSRRPDRAGPAVAAIPAGRGRGFG